MTALPEVAVTSCLNDSVVSVYVYDVQTGTSLMTYRGDTPVTAAGLSLLSSQYVVAAVKDKPFLRVWPVNSQQPLTTLRLVCPGRVTHAQTSPDNCYIAVTVAEKLHLYQVASGCLVGTGVRHFQPIRVVRWSGDGGWIVCGGEDGLVTVWLLSVLATGQSAPQPRHVLSDHTLPVTDLTVTAGTRLRLVSVSADRTCKIYDLCQGTLLVSLVCDIMLTAVATAVLETDVFLGTDRGSILQVGLLSPPRHLEYHLSPEECAPAFIGHSKAVRSLSASFNGDVLMSGSADGSVKIWHISSRQCLRTLTHKGPITNAFFTLKPKQMFYNELKPSVVLSSFRNVNSEETDCVEVITEQSVSLCDCRVTGLFPPQVASDSSKDRVKSLQTEVELLRSINTSLYKFAVDKIIGSNKLVPSVPKESVINSKTKSVNVNVLANGMKKNKKKRKNKKKKTKV